MIDLVELNRYTQEIPMKDSNFYIKEANRRLTRTIVICWFVTVALFFACIFFGHHVIALARWTGKHVPSVGDQFAQATALGDLAGTYFGISALLLPFAVLALIWRQSALKRLRLGLSRLGGGFRAFLIIYLGGIPFIAFMLFMFYAAPFDISNNPRLAGQYIVNLMLNTSFGLLSFGSILLVVISLLIGMLLAFLWFPFALVIEKIKES